MSKTKNEVLVGYTNEIYKIENVGSRFNLVNTAGEVESDSTIVTSFLRKKAHNSNSAIRGHINKAGKKSFRMVDMNEYSDMLVKPINTNWLKLLLRIQPNTKRLLILYTKRVSN